MFTMLTQRRGQAGQREPTDRTARINSASATRSGSCPQRTAALGAALPALARLVDQLADQRGQPR